jgi:hypothetical protein
MSDPRGSGDRDRAGDRLVKAFRVSKKMRPFVSRMRMGVDDLDLTDPAKASQFERSREEMGNILAEKKISDAKAKHAIALTLAAAADHQLQSLRQSDSQRDRVRSAGDVGKMIARLEELVDAIAKLPPVSKKKLNAIVANHAKQFFDTETFAAMIQGIADALPKLAPKRRAQDALDVIDQSVAGVIRTSPPELIERWETMSAETRREVEQAVRGSTAKRSAIKFLRRLVVLSDEFSPQAKLGRLLTIQRRYIERVSKIWQALGLRIGRAYDGMNSRSVESSFQRFARLALAAVGDDSVISRRQIAKPKNMQVLQKGKTVHSKAKSLE